MFGQTLVLKLNLMTVLYIDNQLMLPIASKISTHNGRS